MPNLYSQADSNVRKTWALIVFFLIFVIGLGWLFSYLLNDIVFLVIASFLAILQVVTGFFYSDKIILKMSGAQEIKKEDHLELYRTVENLCITAGLPLPKIYITNESQPNAFTTGRKKEKATIVVTRGLLEKLDSRELEGVIAHELAHVGNRDVFLASLIVILVSVVAILSRLFLRFNFWGRKRDRDKSGLLGLLGLIGALLAPLVALLIQLSISRKREFLADADGALLTRDPQGLAKALKKISFDQSSMRRLNPSTSHLYFSNPFKEKNYLSKLFMTHPPTEERVKALEGM